MVDNGKVIANVSANIMKFVEKGMVKNYIQLGTVMTDKAYRNQGLSRKLLEAVLIDYKDKADGFYLFANNSVLDFYPKFGFKKSKEYQYVKAVNNEGELEAVRLPMDTKSDWDKLEAVINESINNSSFEMVGNAELILFHIINFMRECVYYIKDLDAYIIAEWEKDTLFVHHVFGRCEIDWDILIQKFGKTVKKVMLGFTPKQVNDFDIIEYAEEDTTLFVMGKDLDLFADKKLLFPTLSHA